MSNPISHAFKKAKSENRPALLTYTVAGDSSKKQSLEILKSISKNVDILEIGVPHNTPVADGSQIQTSSYRAIKNGIKVNDIFKIVKDFKKFDKQIKHAKKNNIFAGIHNGSTDYAKKMIEKGFQFVTVGADSRFISAGAKNTVENLKGTVKSELSKAY